MAFSRTNPSPRYRALMDMYRRMHLEGDPARRIAAPATFQGMSLAPQASHVKRLIERTASQSILDYGSGKGTLYRASPFRIEGLAGEWDTVCDYWDVDYVSCYDPCYPPFSTLPTGHFDGVLCTDVLEHCPQEDVPWIVGELFGFASRFVFASIAGYPALKLLPDGTNAHCTVRPLSWWRAQFDVHAAARRQLPWRIRYLRRTAEDDSAAITVDEAGSPA